MQAAELLEKLETIQQEEGVSNSDFARWLKISPTTWRRVRARNMPVGRKLLLGAAEAFPHLADDIYGSLGLAPEARRALSAPSGLAEREVICIPRRHIVEIARAQCSMQEAMYGAARATDDPPLPPLLMQVPARIRDISGGVSAFTLHILVRPNAMPLIMNTDDFYPPLPDVVGG